MISVISSCLEAASCSTTSKTKHGYEAVCLNVYFHVVQPSSNPVLLSLPCGRRVSRAESHGSPKRTISAARKRTACLCLLLFPVQSLLYSVPASQSSLPLSFAPVIASMCYVYGSIDQATGTCRMCKVFKPSTGRCVLLQLLPISVPPHIHNSQVPSRHRGLSQSYCPSSTRCAVHQEC